MTIAFKLPSLGENIDSGDVVKLLVKTDQVIAANDPVLELETDKAVVELPCPHAGRVTAIHVTAGQTVRVGEALLSLEPQAEPAADDQAAGDGERAAPEAAPAESAEAETAPTESAEGGGAAAEAAPAEARAAEPQAAQEPAGSARLSEDPIPAGPAVRRLARELGVDLRDVRGSGKRGRITPEDVRATAEEPPARARGAAAPEAPAARPERALQTAPGRGEAAQPALARERVVPPGEPGEDQWGAVRRERISRIRQTIGAQMTKAAQTIPHVTNFDDADITRLDALRKDVPQDWLGQGVKLTLMPMLLRAAALSLRQHPVLNASLDEEQQEIIYKEYINLGVAVDTPRGLVVPVLRQVDQLGMMEVARQLSDLAQRARRADFAIEELRGGTFTVSNLGAVGGTYSTPIINHPEVAILLLGRARWLPVVREGHIEPRLMLPLSLSYDHRLVDGAAAGRFLNDLIALVESPGRLLLLG